MLCRRSTLSPTSYRCWDIDLILLPLLTALTVKFIPVDVLERSRRNAEGMWADGRPKKWYYALPVVLVWLLVLALIVKALA